MILSTHGEITSLLANFWKTCLEIGHGDAVQHVVTGLLDGTEQVVQCADVDAWLLVRSQHGVCLPTT